MTLVSLRTQAKWAVGMLVAVIFLSLIGLGGVAYAVVAFAVVWGVWDFVKRGVLRARSVHSVSVPPLTGRRGHT
jgi:hypothetical protein